MRHPNSFHHRERANINKQEFNLRPSFYTAQGKKPARHIFWDGDVYTYTHTYIQAWALSLPSANTRPSVLEDAYSISSPICYRSLEKKRIWYVKESRNGAERNNLEAASQAPEPPTQEWVLAHVHTDMTSIKTVSISLRVSLYERRTCRGTPVWKSVLGYPLKIFGIKLTEIFLKYHRQPFCCKSDIDTKLKFGYLKKRLIKLFTSLPSVWTPL